MSERQEFFKAADEMMQLYNQEKYTQALELVDGLVVAYPDRVDHTALWRICLLSRLERFDEALLTMARALETGLWWAEPALRQDSDLEPLQGLPEFEQMVSVCIARHAAAQARGVPKLLTFEPDPLPTGPLPLLIALHGRSSSAEEDAPYWQAVTQLGWLLALPGSSQPGSPTSYVWDDTEKALAEITAHYAALKEKYALDEQRVVVAGFSQGGARAIQMALSGRIPARGFISVVPGGLDQDAFPSLVESARGRSLRGYLVTGTLDQRQELFRFIHQSMNAAGLPCQMEAHPDLAHEFPPDFDSSLEKALQFLFSQEVAA